MMNTIKYKKDLLLLKIATAIKEKRNSVLTK